MLSWTARRGGRCPFGQPSINIAAARSGTRCGWPPKLVVGGRSDAAKHTPTCARVFARTPLFRRDCFAQQRHPLAWLGGLKQTSNRGGGKGGGKWEGRG